MRMLRGEIGSLSPKAFVPAAKAGEVASGLPTRWGHRAALRQSWKQ